MINAILYLDKRTIICCMVNNYFIEGSNYFLLIYFKH